MLGLKLTAFRSWKEYGALIHGMVGRLKGVAAIEAVLRDVVDFAFRIWSFIDHRIHGSFR